MVTHLSGLGLALAAAAGNNLGKGLQKAATRQLPQLNLARREVVFAYLANPTWLLGLLLDVGGGGAMLAALATAPVSLVQPVAAFGLVLLAGFSHFVLQERLGPSQWRGAAVATLGIAGMGISSSSSSSSSDGSTAAAAAGGAAAAAAVTEQQQPPSPWRVLSCFLLLLLVLGLELLWRQQRVAAAAARRKRSAAAAAAAAAGVGGAEAEAAAAAADAAACGLEAGCCFGFSAAAARTGFQLSPSFGWLCIPMGVAASAGLTSSGFVLQTRGFKHGSALVVCTTAAAASIVAGVVVGLVALAEPLPHSPLLKLLLLGSWAATFVGVSSMAGGGYNTNINIVTTPYDHNKGGSSGSSSSSGVWSWVTGLQHRLGGATKELVLIIVPKNARHRLLPQRMRQWLGRGRGQGLAGVWYALLGFSSKGQAGGYGEGHQGLQSSDRSLSMDDGPGLPVSRSEPDFAAVLAPVGGYRR